jgi:hypothetical protein
LLVGPAQPHISGVAQPLPPHTLESIERQLLVGYYAPIAVTDHFRLCKQAKELGITTTDALAEVIMASPERWRIYKQQGWWHMQYFPHSRAVAYSFLGVGFWFDMLAIAWKDERAKLEAKGIVCI